MSWSRPTALVRLTAAASLTAAALVAGAPASPAPAANGSAASPRAAEAARPGSGGSTDLAPRLTATTFADPPASVRPKYRWWLPQAYVEDDELAAELADIKKSGAGGAEVIGMAFSGTGTSDPDFLSTYAWGTPRWTSKLQTMLEAAGDLDLGLDITVGPRWPAIVPGVNEINDPRAAQQLIYAYEFAAGGTTRTGALPENLTPAPPEGAETTLVTALVARCAEATCATQTSGSRLLDHDSVTEVTGEVGEDGTLTYTFPGDADQTYALITFLQAPSGDKLTGMSATGPNYYLDHLSRQGLEATTDFYDENVMTPEVARAIRKVGRVDFYEDSLELGNSQKWTWDFADQWKTRRGYAPLRDLPALTGAGAQGRSQATFFDFDGEIGDRVRRDYRQTWSDLYRDVRIKGLRSWAANYGMKLRIQPYGHPVDTPDVSTFVDTPEGESLAFNHNIEDYKLVAVGAHRSGSPVVSNECCATREKVWDTRAGGATDPGNLQAVYRGFAGGVNQVVWHGYPYRIRGPEGTGAQNTWPGMSYGGNTSFAEAWGSKGGPNWTDYREINDNLGRLQLVLRQGAPRYDVGVYWQDHGVAGHGTTGSGDQTMMSPTSALAAQGYTYEYVSPAHLDRSDATVRRGKLFADTSGYEALVLKDQTTLPLATAKQLDRLVDDGLVLVIAGDLPKATPGLNDASRESRQVAKIMTRLARSRNVVRVDDVDDVPRALKRRQIRPAAEHSTDSSDVVSVRREDSTTNYYYLFNQTSAPAEQTIALEGEGRPYRLDTWTGKVTPLSDYRTKHGRTVVDVELGAADATVIALSTRRDGTFNPGGKSASGGGHGSARGTVEPTELNDWELAVQSWGPGESGQAGDTAKTDLPPVTLKADTDGTLPPWSDISTEAGYATDLSDVSGIGTYTSTFSLDRSWSGVTGAYLDLGRVVDTVRVSVNGRALPPVDPQELSHVEVGRYLKVGKNTITVRVASTLLNAVRVAPDTGAAGRGRSDYGLFGPVRISPYAAPRASLLVETLDRALPLAEGGTNHARIRIRNGASKPVTVALAPRVDGNAEVVSDNRKLRLRAGESTTAVVRVRGRASSGASTLDIEVSGSNGTSGSASVRLEHTDDLAHNSLGSPYPKTFSSSAQDRYPAIGTTDGDPATFWVSGGNTPGQAPSEQRPEELGIELAEPTEVSAMRLIGRTEYGPKTYEVQTSLDGDRWKTVAKVAEAPKSGQVTSFAPTRARYIRARITAGYYTAQPGNNTQVIELGVYAAGGANLARRATATASSTHANFRVAAVNDGSIAGQSDYGVWNSGNGWNDATKSTWPDTLTLTWADPVELSRAVVHTVDNGTNPVQTFGLRDYDVQALVDGTWTTVDTIRGNTDEATLESRFDQVTATALRIAITDTNDHGYSRVVELEAYGE